MTALAPTLGSHPRLPRWLVRTLVFGGIFLGLALLWEGYKALGQATDGLIPFTSVRLPVRPDDSSMPHVFDIFAALFRPVSRARDADILGWLLIKNAAITWHRAAVGFFIGSLAGFGLGALFARSRLLERGIMPFVVASQTVPLIAIAPMIVIWGGSGAWPSWLVSAFRLDDAGFSVAIISAYLTFFPVTINSLRGLRSPDPAAVELMRSYAATETQVLTKLRMPASIPYVFTALKISATASVIGAIIGELPAGLGDGLGRSLLTFSYYYISGPEKLYAAIVVSALLGITFVSLVSLAERVVVRRGRRRPIEDVVGVASDAVEELGG
ncbi:MAG: ABC transporter permease subunit [Acidimicrobiia bacterium]|nr:ABC transporter permease subunit [Acidimicrobiia bacterium]